MLSKSRSIVLITKDAVPGTVKTRLAASIGTYKAAMIHKELSFHICQIACASGFPVEISFRGDQKSDFARSLRKMGALMYSQCQGSLGDIIYEAMHRNEQVLALGMDMPLLTTDHIHQAFNFDGITLGPAEDGGYWCISGRNIPKELVQNIAWSTPRVLDQTRNKAASLFLPVHLHETKYDIDTHRDLVRLLNDPALPSSLHKRILPYARS